YNHLREWIKAVLTLTIASLVAVMAFAPVGGARRWIRLGPLGVQPAEFAKLAMILYLADYLDRKRSKMDSPIYGLAMPWAVLLTMFGLIALEPDLGTPVLMFGAAIMIFYLGGARMRHILSVIACAIPVVTY